MYLAFCQIYVMALFCKNSKQIIAFNYFCKKALSYMFGRVLFTSLKPYRLRCCYRKLCLFYDILKSMYPEYLFHLIPVRRAPYTRWTLYNISILRVRHRFFSNILSFHLLVITEWNKLDRILRNSERNIFRLQVQLPIVKIGIRTVLRRTFPRRTFPRRTVPRTHFPDGQFPERRLPGKDIYPMDTSPKDSSPSGQFPMNISPNHLFYFSSKKVTDMN